MHSELIRDIVQWDVNSWSQALNFWESKVDWNKVNTALELGSREGGLSLWLALKGKHVVCSDYSDVEKTASPLHNKYKVRPLILYEKIDATNIKYENYFDVIVFKSIVGGIGRNNNFSRQQEVFTQIHKALKPGGKLLFAENLISSPIHQVMRKRFVKWSGDWRYMTIDEIKICLSNFKSAEIQTNGVMAAFGRSESQRNILSRMDKVIFNHITPRRWKYIAYGIAEK